MTWISWTCLAFLLCKEAKRAFNQQLDPVLSLSKTQFLHVHNASWRFLWRHKSRANLALSSWQRQLAFPLCSKAFYFRDTVTSSSSYFSLSHSGTACSLITHHWTAHLLDEAWLIKSFADLIKWKKKSDLKGLHTSSKYMCALCFIYFTWLATLCVVR